MTVNWSPVRRPAAGDASDSGLPRTRKKRPLQSYDDDDDADRRAVFTLTLTPAACCGHVTDGVQCSMVYGR